MRASLLSLSSRRCGTASQNTQASKHLWRHTTAERQPKATHADRDDVAPAHPRVGVRAARVVRACERVRVLVEDDRRRAAAEYALSARVLVRRQAVDDVAAIVADIPCACRGASAEREREVGENVVQRETPPPSTIWFPMA